MPVVAADWRTMGYCGMRRVALGPDDGEGFYICVGMNFFSVCSMGDMWMCWKCCGERYIYIC